MLRADDRRKISGQLARTQRHISRTPAAGELEAAGTGLAAMNIPATTSGRHRNKENPSRSEGVRT
jgi:hypothetical protein